MIVIILLFILYLVLAAVYRKRARKRFNEIREGRGTVSLAQAGLLLFGMPAIGSTVDFRMYMYYVTYSMYNFLKVKFRIKKTNAIA